MSSILEAQVSENFRSRVAAELDVLRQRAAFLTARDRTLVELYLSGQNTVGELANLYDAHRGTITRRVELLLRRLRDPLIGRLIERSEDLAPRKRMIALAHLLQRRTIGELAKEFEMSPGAVRQALAYVRGWFRVTGSTPAGRGTSGP